MNTQKYGHYVIVYCPYWTFWALQDSAEQLKKQISFCWEKKGNKKENIFDAAESEKRCILCKCHQICL